MAISLNTKWFLPQNRERVYLVGYAPGKSRGQVFPIGKSNTEVDELQRQQGSGNTIKARYNAKGVGAYVVERKQPSQEIGDYRYDEGFRWREDNDSPTLTLKSNEIVIKQNNSPYLEIKTNNSKGFEEMTEGDSLNYSNPNSKTRRGRVGKGVAQTLDTGCEQAVFQNNIRRLTPLECERLQGFPDNWTQYGTEGIISDTQRYKMCGNAVTVNVVEAVGKQILKL